MSSQGDYRIFIGAFPGGALAETLQALRLEVDAKTACITPPHVTLWGTAWRTGPATAENEAGAATALASVCSTEQPFDLHMGGIQTFGDGVVYLAVADSAGLTAVRAALVRTFGSDKHRDFTPHLTLAMRLTHAQTVALADRLRSSAWQHNRFSTRISALQLMQRGPSDAAWRAIYRAPLTGSAEAGQTTGSSAGYSNQ